MTYVRWQPEEQDDSTGALTSLDPSLLMAARKIYSSYCKTHTSENVRRPVGAVISQETHRGQLIFKGRPVLLFHERFVPFEEIAEPVEEPVSSPPLRQS